MIKVLKPFNLYSNNGGMFINSCFAHCQSEMQETWFGADSPRINNKVQISFTTSYITLNMFIVFDYRNSKGFNQQHGLIVFTLIDYCKSSW
jgi:hypothetical protein